MYESPIHIQVSKILDEIREELDTYIWRQVQDVGVDVDRNELYRALSYDRDQYSKGFADGVESCQKTIESLQTALNHAQDELKHMGYYRDL